MFTIPVNTFLESPTGDQKRKANNSIGVSLLKSEVTLRKPPREESNNMLTEMVNR